MSDFKHTPGPWTQDEKDECLIRGEQGRRICWTATASPGDLKGKYASRRQGDEENARLIAAAPELLEALMDAKHFNGPHMIRSVGTCKDCGGMTPNGTCHICRKCLDKKMASAIAKATGKEPA